ncbi:methylthioribose-1-phosphate isomerase [Streptomyces sp. NBRC 110611]|uniref:bifunctional S-methyl-5-thioribose-1-phosphate isomerase/methylthioribulose 1-phosphate dehydratase n=1 Tax=Streptomyces sp. NBRC 110611 TaxID=1621259 RepID=UPI0008351152|nr:bifunctional S-methyl-5-thioribose-1-phosphate isomerase/methylthioribulose 1-phosphate dehydratase [Streptomyces sp. NBRC 110611]GAU65772.1 methylthioribose-1-phosphate isomerase [Streptomyces sp. NBRC 110611]
MGTTTGELSPGLSLRWQNGALLAVDQRLLPHTCRLLRLDSVDALIAAVQALAIRGAPALGLAGAFGVALSAQAHHRAGTVDEPAVRADARRLATARPTAVNLARGVQRALGRLPQGPQAVLGEARKMVAEDAAVNSAAANRAADLVETLVPDRPLRLLTHCNTGLLATGAVGTALGAILELARRGRVAEVLVDETRPLLQGSRLTAWELREAKVPYRVCVDSAAAAAMSRGLVDCVLVGADRIAANGDTANKIGTYGLALAAARHRLPFLVVAPESTWDESLPDGSGIVVEERDGAEVVRHGDTLVAPADAAAFNPAFDVTPRELITALVTEDRADLLPHATRPSDTGPRPVAVTTSGEDGVFTAAARTSLAELSRELYLRGWMPGTAGNLSVRLAEERAGTALITASGRDKGSLTGQDIVAVDAATGEVRAPGRLKASAETAIHVAVYTATAAGAVVHVHSPYATVMAGRTAAPGRTALLPLTRFELLKGLGLRDPSHTVLPVFPNWPDVRRIADEVAAYLASRPDAAPALLIADHGITVWGRDLAQARSRLECVEAVCQLLVLGAGDGGTEPREDQAP